MEKYVLGFFVGHVIVNGNDVDVESWQQPTYSIPYTFY